MGEVGWPDDRQGLSGTVSTATDISTSPERPISQHSTPPRQPMPYYGYAANFCAQVCHDPKATDTAEWVEYR
jgi:hypothetical protein